VFFINIFDLIGPIMVGPSSSHTAGAVNIARAARMLLGEDVKKAKITLYGSFAHTYTGHGTDKALIAGLMDFKPEDERIRDSDDIAKEKGIEIEFIAIETGNNEHPNTAILDLEGIYGAKTVVQGASVGGGNIRITKINGALVDFSCQYYTLVGVIADTPGMVGATTTILGKHKINIAGVRAYRRTKGTSETVVLETDQPITEDILNEIKAIPGVINLIFVNRL